MKNASLVLCPENPHWVPPDDQGLERLLQSIQLIGEPYQNKTHFLPGERFLEMIAFMGCSPDIRLEPGDNDAPFCNIHLLPRTAEVEFHCGDQAHAPRCPRCRTPVNDWQNNIITWRENGSDSQWTCQGCRHQAFPWEFNWRKSAGFGRCIIEINNVFPKEAIPQQQLLDTLNSHYGVSWHYFYLY